MTVRIAWVPCLALAACASRTVYETPECPPPPAPPPARIVSREMASRTVLVGRVVDQHTGGNVVGATVSWQNGGASGDYIVEDSSGFVLPLAAGPAVVRVALIGFRVSEDTLWLGPRDSIEVTFPLDAIALDGCGFGVVVKRKAWWHFW